MKIKLLIIAGIFIIIITGLSLAATGWKRMSPPKSALQKRVIVPKKDTIYPEPAYDPVLLKKFETICHLYDTVKNNYTISGMIDIVDHSDTTVKPAKLNFLICKQDDNFYYKLGNTVTVNAGGSYIYIDNQAKHILIGVQKSMQADQIGSLAGIGKTLKSEYYKMSSSIKGSVETISLLNEQHISMKQYSIAYDTVTMQMKHIFLRLSNTDQPLRKDNEKTIDVTVDNWIFRANLDSYLVEKYVTKDSRGAWKPFGNYAGYELTQL